MWRDSGTVGARMAWNVASPAASAASAAAAAGAMASKMPSSASRIAVLVAGDQLGVVEVVAGVHPHASGRRRRMAISRSLSSSEILMPSTLAACAR